MSALPAPRKYESEILRRWLSRSTGGDHFLDSLEAQPYHQANEHDLIALAPTEFDKITGWLAERVMPWLVRHGLSNAVCPDDAKEPQDAVIDVD
jgi:hypothetical protein